MDALALAAAVGIDAAAVAVVVLLGRTGPTPRIPLRRVALFAVVSLGAGFIVSTLLAFAALRSITPDGYPGDAGRDLGSALGVGLGIALVFGGAGVVGCVVGGMLAARRTSDLGLRFIAAAVGALAGPVVVAAASGIPGAGGLVPIIGFALAGGAIAPWAPGFLRAGRVAVPPVSSAAPPLGSAPNPPGGPAQ